MGKIFLVPQKDAPQNVLIEGRINPRLFSVTTKVFVARGQWKGWKTPLKRSREISLR